MKLLVRFAKGPEARYISHLDMQRLFQRALRRAKIPCAYSNGFNPHQLISFACALPVGVCSNAEYVEVVIERYLAPEDVLARLNRVLPKGIRALAASFRKDEQPPVGGVLALAEYTLAVKGEFDPALLMQFLSRDEIMIEKKTKRGMESMNIRPLIHRLKLQNGFVYATLTCSNTENLRVDKLAELLCAYGCPVGQAVRTVLYVIEDGQLCEPLGAEA